jgi:membrane associated rhomboid family serine protease
MSGGDSRHRSDGELRATLQRGHLWLIGALISSVVLLAVAGTDVRQLLRYERAAVLEGEWWRLLTGHLVHGGLRHLSLNVAGIGLVALLFGRDYSPGHWLFVLLASTLAIDLGFVFYQPQLEWYVGLSGVLHGCIAGAKLFWEQYRGALPLSGDMPVVVAAHLYGAIGGALAAASIAILQQRWPPRSTSL